MRKSPPGGHYCTRICIHGSVEPFSAGLTVSICLTVDERNFQMFADLDSVLVVGTMCVLLAHELLMAEKPYDALAQIMEDIAEGIPVRPEDWEIIWNWMHMMEEQVTE